VNWRLPRGCAARNDGPGRRESCQSSFLNARVRAREGWIFTNVRSDGEDLRPAFAV
jgi:hypothetical protein